MFDSRDALGRIGEKIIANIFSQHGAEITESIDPYDSVKDMVIDGETVEVKTQVPFIREKSFTIKKNQLRKCRNVDRLFFVSVPAPRHTTKWDGLVFSVNPKTFITREHTTNDGRTMTLIPIEQEAVRMIHEVDDTTLSNLRRYTTSQY